MNPVVIIASLGILAGLGVLWHELRRAPLMPPDYGDEPHPMPPGPGELKPTPPPPETLRREEERQRPQEGRN
jgi:hypothetical protein